MSGGTFSKCPACGKLHILGATCTCGQRTDLPVERPIDWSRMHHGICPKCREDKFIGHGPLCGDCYLAGAQEADA